MVPGRQEPAAEVRHFLAEEFPTMVHPVPLALGRVALASQESIVLRRGSFSAAVDSEVFRE
jgi:hypothetical protein